MSSKGRKSSVKNEVLPTGWVSAAIDQFCEMYQPKTISRKQLVDNGPFPVFGANGQIGFYTKFNHEDSEVIVGCRGSCGVVHVTPAKAWITGNAMVVRPKDASMSKEFLKYLLLSADFSEVITGSNQPQITRATLSTLKISVPPVKVQKKIVKMLDEQFSYIKVCLDNIHTAEEKTAQFRSSLLHAAFTGALTGSGGGVGNNDFPDEWSLELLNDILVKLPNGKILIQGKSPQCEEKPSVDIDIWGVLKTTAIQMGEFLPVHNKMLPSDLTPNKLLEAESGDILLTCAGPRKRCGVPCLVRETRPRLMLSGKMYRFRPNNEIISAEFLELYLQSPMAQRVIDGMKTGSSESGLNLTQKRFKNLIVPLPSKEEQNKIVRLVSNSDSYLKNLVITLSCSSEDIHYLRKSLLRSAFSGRLSEYQSEDCLV